MGEEENKIKEDSEKISMSLESTERESSLIYFLLGLSVAVIFMAIIVLGIQKTKANQVESLDQNIETRVTQPLAAMSKQDKEATTVVSQVKALNVALGERINLSKILDDIAANTYKQTQFTSISRTEVNKYQILGVVNNFNDLAKTLTGLKAIKAIKSIEISGVNIDEQNQINYTIDIVLTESVYLIKGTSNVGQQ
ncbi:hypothetical protein COT77_00785 [Candidatus Berkelbacteria bacterium CG10_big_fil_rev_8_21_14_0_10_41_12]|uniref:Uncharacterized protein n=1 Tax=Candidatus Berkelbacteria bacterium CG10_big_fil_rev_8_21_14_0_10_41_12 TaxID=1974513 RepID=A0A2M6WXP3_9BACT|nr:MAG: hypothetical protein COT77_00785 [Candidatus Berkelbacteria bacterium CG10_big_fil_rev_8_21_14_0_10_41_12]